MKLRSADARFAEPWKNGRGRTTTVESAAGWRVSIAEISDASPFSSFPGAGRMLMPLSPAGVVFSVNGQRRVLGCHQPIRFEGEDAVHALERGGSTEVLNLMWRRDSHFAELRAVSVAQTLRLEAAPATVLVAVVTDGRFLVAQRVTLDRLDALRIEGGETVTCSGTGEMALARIRDL